MNVKEDNKAGLIEKYLRNEATAKEKKLLSETEMVEQCMKKQWQQGGTTTDKECEERIWNNVQHSCNFSANTYHRHLLYWKWIAACVAIFILSAGIWYVGGTFQNRMVEFNEIYADECRMLMLPDSSKVWLQPGSSVRYAAEFQNHRDVWLKGDAVFEVKRQEQNPFKVIVNDAFVEVKGTVFRVNNQSSYNEITLFSGRIDLYAEKTGELVSMKPDQRAYIDRENNVTLRDIKCLKWSDGQYTFNDLRLDSLLTMIDEMYGTQIVLDKKVMSYSHNLFSGSIKYDDEPLNIIRKICYNLDLEYRTDGKRITIYHP